MFGAAGYASVGGMCSSEYSCSIVREMNQNPRSTALTVAHELGHSLGMDHDNEQSIECQKSQDDLHFVMNNVNE